MKTLRSCSPSSLLLSVVPLLIFCSVSSRAFVIPRTVRSSRILVPHTPHTTQTSEATQTTACRTPSRSRLQAATMEATLRSDTLMWIPTASQSLRHSITTAKPVYRWKHGPTHPHHNHHHHHQQQQQRGTLGIVLHETTPQSFSNVDWTWDLSDETTQERTPNSSINNNNNNKNAPLSRSNKLIWSNFAPSYQVMDRMQKERPDLNLDEWQAELLAQDPESVWQGKETTQTDGGTNHPTTTASSSSHSSSHHKPTPTVNSLAEWVRTVDLEPLLQRREEIHRQKRHGKKPTLTARQKSTAQNNKETSREELVQSLTKLLDTSSNTKYSNYQVKQMYAAAKLADQQGQPHVAQQILEQLIEATPADGRLYRRLARLHKERGRWSQARATLQRGLRVDPQNAYLWHGLGTLAANEADAKRAYRRALRCDPYLAQSYHALGTLQHSQGQIANAMQTLQKGITHCPTNHRLQHALGDLYREAKMLPMASKAYRKVLQIGPSTSHGFAYIALAYVEYEQGNVEAARKSLTKATQLLHGRNANAWKSLALLEEAEGRTERARHICQTALDKYEQGLLKYHQRCRREQQEQGGSSVSRDSSMSTTGSVDAVAVKNALLQNVPIYRSGDRFFQLYRTWTRLEERYGTFQSTEAVYARATAAFPHATKIWLDRADWYVRLGLADKARPIFSAACHYARDSLPFRRFAEFEMSRKNVETARKILFRGALKLSQADGDNGLAELYHTWAIAEWHLEDLNRAEILLDHALRLTPAGTEGAALRSTLLYSLARLQLYNDEPLLAQHCIALCLKENVGPLSPLWELWADVARAMDNESLASECQAQAARAQSSEDMDQMSSLLLNSKSPSSGNGLQDKMRRDPWHFKIFNSAPEKSYSPFAYGVQLPAHDGSNVSTNV